MEQRNIPNRHREGTGPATAPLSAPYLTPPTRVVACMAPNLESNPGWGLGIGDFGQTKYATCGSHICCPKILLL